MYALCICTNSYTKTSFNPVKKAGELALTHEVEVPGPLGGDHEEAQEAVRQEHLYFLVVRGEVTPGVVSGVLVVPAPFVARRRQFVGSEGTGSRSETEIEFSNM